VRGPIAWFVLLGLEGFALMATVSLAAHAAPITYAVNRTLGPNGVVFGNVTTASVVGTITTDGTTGDWGPTNHVIEYTLTLTTVSGSVTYAGTGALMSAVAAIENGLGVSLDGISLYFDFSKSLLPPYYDTAFPMSCDTPPDPSCILGGWGFSVNPDSDGGPNELIAAQSVSGGGSFYDYIAVARPRGKVEIAHMVVPEPASAALLLEGGILLKCASRLRWKRGAPA